MRIHNVDERTGYLCGAVALAAVTGRPVTQFPKGRMRLLAIADLLRPFAKFKLKALYGQRHRTLANVLPINGFGIVRVRGHVLAFEGKIVRDTLSGRRMWVYDHHFRRHRVTHLLLIESVS